MRITLIQDTISWADKEANFKSVENHLSKLKGGTDLVVLPEMFSTGFCTDIPELAETMGGETVKQLKSWAINYQIAITGSFIATENGNNFNRGFFVFPNGEIKVADKRHLFSVGGEDKSFLAGNKKLLINYKGLNIQVLICYDLRFPVWARNVDNAYDLLIFVANFPEKRIRNWDILLQARAIENQCYVCGVNRVGMDGVGISYSGHSVLLDYFATPILSFNQHEIGVATAKINIESLLKFRSKSPFWKDADKFRVIQ